MIDEPCTPLITVADIEANCDLDQFHEEDPPTDQGMTDAAAAASRVTWALAGRQHGVCALEGERPGRVRRANRCARPYRNSSGNWVNGCACSPVDVVLLGQTPVVSIEEVRIGGEVLEVGGYELVGSNRLVRRDGGHWPACQLLHLPDGDPQVLEVDYTWGQPLDTQGVRAAAELACELLKAKYGSASTKCRLPERVTSVTRQGISFVLLDTFDFLQEGRTGVYAFDQWLGTVNPEALQRQPRVRTPDVAVARGGATPSS
jgi:hypothetical protein